MKIKCIQNGYDSVVLSMEWDGMQGRREIKIDKPIDNTITLSKDSIKDIQRLCDEYLNGNNRCDEYLSLSPKREVYR